MMASFSTADLSFVDPIPPTLDIECPVCFGILFEPYLGNCCGHHFCGTCLPKLKHKPCPLCKKSFSTMFDQSLKRQIGSLKIYCPLEEMGCEWTGELSFKSKHEQQCLYVLLECENGCGKKIQRSLMDKHRTQHCSKRLINAHTVSTSQHLINFDDVNVHSQSCPGAVINCPNGCSAEISRRNLSKHLKECPLKEVECEFAQYGCKWKQKQEQLESHLNESWKLHNSFVIKSFNTKISSQQEIISALRNQVANLKKVQDTRIKNLEDNVGRLRAEFEESRVESDDDNDEIIISRCDTRFYVGDYSNRSFYDNDCCLCPEMYIGRPGYKIRLVVLAGGVGFAKGTHVSVFIRFLRGSYDSQLRWPFRGEITIRLCDQVHGEDNYERIVRYTNKTASQYAEIAPGWDCSDDMGIAKFISHETLERDDWLLDNDRLEFEISRMAYKT